MADLGYISLLLALAMALYSATGSLLGVWQRAPQLVQSARHATYLAPVALGVATASLVGAFVAHGMRPGPQIFQEQGPLMYALLITIVFANGDVKIKKRFINPRIGEGATIIVQMKEPEEPFNFTQYATNLASVITSFATLYLLAK